MEHSVDLSGFVSTVFLEDCLYSMEARILGLFHLVPRNAGGTEEYWVVIESSFSHSSLSRA